MKVAFELDLTWVHFSSFQANPMTVAFESRLTYVHFSAIQAIPIISQVR